MAPYFKRYKQIKVHEMRQIKTHLNSKTPKKKLKILYLHNEHTENVRCISMADFVSYPLIWMVKLCPGPNMCTVLLISKHTLKMTWIRIIAYICTRFNHNVQLCFYHVLITFATKGGPGILF